jgi:hypothetical protein
MTRKRTPNWMSFRQMAKQRDRTPQAIGQMVDRIERTSGRKISEWRVCKDAMGRRRRMRGVLTDALMASIRAERHEVPALPELREIQKQLTELTDLIASANSR